MPTIRAMRERAKQDLGQSSKSCDLSTNGLEPVSADDAFGDALATLRGTFFTIATSVLGIALLIAGGLTALQTVAIMIALPFSVVMLLICWATVLAFQRERRF